MPKAAVLWFDAPTDLRARNKRGLPSVAGIAVEVSWPACVWGNRKIQDSQVLSTESSVGSQDRRSSGALSQHHRYTSSAKAKRNQTEEARSRGALTQRSYRARDTQSADRNSHRMSLSGRLYIINMQIVTAPWPWEKCKTMAVSCSVSPLVNSAWGFLYAAFKPSVGARWNGSPRTDHAARAVPARSS
jgi:hypothetical protein